MHQAYIGVGSNIRPEKNIEKALALLSESALITGISNFYQTEPFDRPGQPLFYNGVVLIQTEADPLDLKYAILRNIEKKLGRRRTKDKCAARTIDLDILVYDAIVMDTEKLRIPDPNILQKPFLAIPLHELAGDMVVPGWNLSMREIAENFKRDGMRPLPEYTIKLRRIIKNGRK